jgi:hypothetical protein
MDLKNFRFSVCALTLAIIIITGCGGGGGSSTTNSSGGSSSGGGTPASFEKTYDGAYGGSMTVKARNCDGLYGTWHATVTINNAACSASVSADYQWDLSASSTSSPYEWSLSYACAGSEVTSSHIGIVAIDGSSLRFDETSLETVCVAGVCVPASGQATDTIDIQYGSVSGC